MLFQQNYKVLSVSALEERLKLDNIKTSEFDSSLGNNNAHVYLLNSGEVILLPNTFTAKSNGLLLSNKETLLNFIERDSFPMKMKIRLLKRNTNLRLKMSTQILMK